MADGVVEIDRNGLEVLSREECLRLLSTATIGRLGLSSGALPVVLPVNFLLVDGRIVFRTNVGTKLERATRNAVVAFEVDDFDAISHTGWSVVVTGEADEVSDPDELAELERAHVPSWAPSRPQRLVQVTTTLVSGRRILPGASHRAGAPPAVL